MQRGGKTFISMRRRLFKGVGVEDIIRANGATPATIGILDGVILVGMTQKELNTFAQARVLVMSRQHPTPQVI